MIYKISRTKADITRSPINFRENISNKGKLPDYRKAIVKKPWGYEYLVFQNNYVAIGLLHIVRKRKTSMHCHPRKKTGLILLSGEGLFKHIDETIELGQLDSINIKPGAFHSTEAFSSLPICPISENGILIMEIESPPIKNDLCRIDDVYGRAGTSYEGKQNMVFQPKATLKFSMPSDDTINTYNFHNLIFSVGKASSLIKNETASQPQLACVIDRPASNKSKNPYLTLGEIFDYNQLKKHIANENIEDVMLLTVRKEEKQLKLTDYIANYIADLGIKHIFAVCGGGAMHLVDSFGINKNIKYIATHHEQAAAMAAEGYARISGTPGATLVTSGPGGTNAITGVYGSFIDSIPHIVISGQVTQDTLIKDTGLRQFGIQEGNIIEIVKPITKYAVTVTDPNTIRYHLEKACHLAITGRPGPVWLDIPLDVQSKTINPEAQKGYTPPVINIKQSERAISRGVSKCIELLAKAKRPVLIYGYGIHLSKTERQLLQLVEALKIPVISSWTASDIIPTSNPYYIGRSGILGDRAGNFTTQNADLIIILGSRMSIPQVGYNYNIFARGAKKIMVDIDSAELNKPSLKLDMKILADLREFIDHFLKTINKNEIKLNIVSWRKQCLTWKNKYKVMLSEYKHNTDKVNSFYFVDYLSEKLDSNAVVVTDMGTSFTCTMQTFKVKKGQRLFTSSGLSSMGFGLPGAIGACFARGKQKTILITGDGGLQMNIQELQTVVHHKLPLIIFVLNNEGYLTIKLMQQNHFGRFVGTDPSSGVSCPDIIKIARAYGIKSMRISNQHSLEQNLDKVLAEPGPFICEILMPPSQPLIPRVSSLKLPDGSIVSKPLEDLYPFLDRIEFNKNMIIQPLDVLRQNKRIKNK